MRTSLLIFIIGLATIHVNGQPIEKKLPDNWNKSEKRKSIDTSPISPLIDIWGVHFNYHITSKDELITGLSYMKIPYDFGNTNSPALIFGYRRYLWKNLHIEYQLWPCYDEFYEKNENKIYKSFDVWNEFRFGYQFNFNIANLPFYTSVQWPFGFGLYASNKPDSFLDYQKDNRFFYQFPLLFVGYRF